jgi:DNA-binding beta-propeller fold protein YncE
MRRLGNSTLRWLEAGLVFATLASADEPALAATESVNIFTLTVGAPSSLATAVLFDGKSMWVALQNPGGGTLEKLSLSGTLLATASVGQVPIEMAYDGQNVWVTNYTSSTVSVVDQRGVLLKTISLPAAMPEGIMFDGKYIWTANNGPGANSVTKIDAVAKTIVGTYSVGLSPDGVAFDGSHVWVTNSQNNNVWKIDRNSGTFVDGYQTGLFPLSIIFDGTNMWIGNGTGVNVGPAVPGTGSLSKIRAADGVNLGTFAVGNHVRGLVYDGASIWACNGNDNTVSRIRTGGVALLGTYPTGKSPRVVAFDGTNIWVANSGENTLTVIAPPAADGSPGQLVAADPPTRALGIGSPKVVTARSVVPGTIVGPLLNVLLDDH